MRVYSKALILFAVYMVFASQVIAASFSILSDLSDENYNYYPRDVSADGSVVAGDIIGPVGPYPAFHLLTQSYDIEFVYRVQNQNLSREWTHGIGLSADGTVVVGLHDGSLFSPFYWTRNIGMVFLQTPGSSNGYTTAASSDGSVIVGSSLPTPGLGQALRWTQNGDVSALDNIAEYEFSKAYDVSHDGSVIVGISQNTLEYQAFRWTQNDGTVGLGFLPGDNVSLARAISADGSVIIGWSKRIAEEPPYDESHSEAFRWTESGMVGLGFLPGTDNSEAQGVSGDGSVVVGHSGEEPVIWDSTNGMRSLVEVLTYDFDIDLSDFQITSVNAISADGATIVGGGYNKSNQFSDDNPAYENTKGWIANIDTSKGSLEVTIDPPEAVSTGAQWQIDGGDWKNSEDSVIEIDPGNYTINFNEISGWKIPDTQTVRVTALSKNSVIATYTKVEYGSITLTIQPSGAASIGAKWRVDVGEWRDSGYTETDLETGNHIVEFKTITGWTAPGNQQVTINNEETTEITGTYTQQFGSLTVTIEPEAARSAGAQWRVGNGEWRDSGATQNGIPVGDRFVEFKTIVNFDTLAVQTVNIKFNETTTISQTYTAQSGSLTVNISPGEAVAAGAKWRVNGGPWKDPDEIANGLDDGTYTLEFKEVTGWTTPDSQSVTITDSEIAVSNALYTEIESDDDTAGDDGGGSGGGVVGGCFIGSLIGD